MLARLASMVRPRPPRETFGLDIGSSSIKVLELRDSATSHIVAKCAVAPLRGGAVAEGSIHEPAPVADAIQSAMKLAGITRRHAVIGLCGRGLIIKRVQIPEVPIKELPDAIRIEAEHEIPFAVDEVCLDFHVMGRHNGTIDVALVAARRSKVAEYRAVVREAGLLLAVVDVDGFALGNYFQLHRRPGLYVVVDIGATMTKLSVVQDGLTLLVRDLPSGGQACTMTIAARLGASTETAEAIKIDPGPASHAVAPACEALAAALGLEIQRTLDYLAASGAGSEPPREVVLAGGSAQLTGLTPRLASILNLPVELARPFEGVAIDPTCRATIAAAGPALALALGLSLRQPGDGQTGDQD